MFIKSYHASPVYGSHGNKGWYGVEGEDEDGVGEPGHGVTQELQEEGSQGGGKEGRTPGEYEEESGH